jgi:tetratricopeptide (TPR) repeat protein/class 3 adenylate cyclase
VLKTGESVSASPPDAAAGAERWARLESLLHQALAHEPSERAQFLDAACGADADARREVEALLEAHDRPGRLDALADDVMLPLRMSGARARDPRRDAAATTPPAPSRFRILDRLGGGGMGVVYRARDERLEREVALKFLPPHLNADEAAKKRFMVEARAAASLEHPNICTVHEIGETEDGQLYIVMACYEGETLDRRIARGPLPLDEALRVAADVARGLARAHDRGIIHRDVKPANIMLTADGVVKILDFGIAKLADAGVTTTGGVLGTIAYMSPEQAYGDLVDRRTDIWALGVVLYEMLTGVRPFRESGDQALLFAILSQEPQPLSDVRTDAPPELEALLRRALAKRSADRFSSAHDLLAALTALPDLPQGRVARPMPDFTSDASPPADATQSLLTRAGERRQASVVVTGIAGYASLVERLAPEEIDRITTAVRDAAAEIAMQHGGIVNHFAGDDAVILFGVATAHEDDPMRAVRATLDLHAQVRALSATSEQRLGVAIRLRSGVHIGSVVAQRQRSGDRRFRITGAPLDLAARLAAFADADAILISPECRRLVGPFFEAMPGASLAITAGAPEVTPFRVVGASDRQTRLEVAERAGLTPYAGRSRELHVLEEQLASAVDGRGGIVIVTGEAGVGKSRLLYELRRRVDASRARLLMGRCDAYGGTTPYLPFVQALRELLELTGDEAPGSAHREVVARVRGIHASLGDFLPLYFALLSIPSDEYPLPRHLHGEHLHAAMLEALAALITLQARQQPLVLLLEDWHWADEASRATLEQLEEIAPAHHLLVVVSCRPDAGIAWTAAENRTLLHLGPLGLDASLEIMRAVLAVARVSPDLAHQLYERTSGNPFFLEETCQALTEEGAVVVREGEAVAAGASGVVHLPETVQAVIRTRFDRLDPEARDALRMASVIGREFSRGVLDQLAGPPHELTRPLERLRGSGLIQQTSIVPEPLYRFKHVLTQEVAYDTLLEHQRTSLHALAGRAIEQRYADRLDEHLERLAHHFSRAEEWQTGVRYGIRAADRAQGLSQFADALATLDRVQEWLPYLPDADERQDLLADVLLRQERLCETLGLRARQLRLVEELIARLAPLGASARLAEAYLRQGDVCTLLRRYDAADRALGTALRISRERGDTAGERNAYRSIGLLRSHATRYEEAIESLERALAMDRELGDAGSAAADLASLGNVLRNMGRPEEALASLEQALEDLTARNDPTKRCAVMTVIGSVHRELGDADTAVRYLEGARDEAAERRLPIVGSFSLLALAHLYLQLGRAEESLRTYREAVELSRRARHAEGLAQSLRALGEVLFGLGRFGEAKPLFREAAGLFAQLEDREAEALIYMRLATTHERLGDVGDARAAWETARERCQRIGDRQGEVRALEGIARAARHQEARSVAIAHYEEALRHAMHIGDREHELSVRNSLGILQWESGAFTDALEHYEVALRLCRAMGDRVHEGLMLNSLGATLLRLRRLEEARTALEEAARTNAATGERTLEAHSLATLGEVCLAIGRAEDARRHVEASLAARRELGDRRGEGWMLEQLARVLDALGRADDAAVARATADRIAQDIADAALSAALSRTAGPRLPEPTPQVRNAPIHH